MLSENEFDYDLIIVGGGPAGVSCAITVAKHGYSVVIIDKKSRDIIGDKTCGDAIDKAALERFKEGTGIELPVGDEISDPIKRMSIAAGSMNTKLSLIAPGFVLDRLNYGQRLLQEAENLGVEIISDAPVRDVLVDTIDSETYIQGIIYLKNGERKKIRAKFTVDASGAYAVVRKKLPDEMLNDGIVRELSDDDQWPSYREIIQLNKDTPHHDYDNEIILLYKDDFAPPGYFWIFTKGERQLNCGIGWMKYQSKNLGSVKKGYLKELNNYYKPEDYTVLKTGGGQIPVRPPFDSLVFNGGALAGDAACMVHPVTAEGHGPALDTAVHLGNSIVKGLKKNQRNKEVLWDYNIEVSRHYAKKHSQAVIMRDFLEKVGAKSLEYLIKKQIFKNEEMDMIFSGEELILSGFDKLKRGLKLVRKPRLLLNLIKIFSRFDKCETIFENYPINHKELMNWRKHRNKILHFNF